MMSRTQISLDPEIKRRARQRASELGISFAQYVRKLVARDLEKPSREANPSAVFDLGDSGGADVARNKDTMVGEAAAARRGSAE